MSYPSSLPLGSVRFGGGYLTDRAATIREVSIPHQWEALNDRVADAEPSGAVRNLKIAAGAQAGEFYGIFFQDSDLAKWIEAACYRLAAAPDPALSRIIEELVAWYCRAQGKDGYFNTYFQLKEPDRKLGNLRDMHELYCAGHLIEAGVAHYRVTGQRALLDMVRRLADFLVRRFGPGPERSVGYCGHPEIELALVKLGRATGDARYRRLAAWFVDQRGTAPAYFELEAAARAEERPPYYTYHDGLAYWQAHKPVREQSEPVGHCVRAMYLYSAMADLALDGNDAGLLESCKRLWRSLVDRYLYVTGGLGADGAGGEKFSAPYDLPTERAYAETCASVGLVMFARRMLELELDGEYGDVMERALLNNVLAGVGLEGTRYFYVNPIEVDPAVTKRRYDCKFVKTQRVPWFGCACCPPNIARLVSSLSDYAFSELQDGLAVHLYVNCSLTAVIDGGRVAVRLATDYPWDGRVTIEVFPEAPMSFSLYLRIPDWCEIPEWAVNGGPAGKAADGAGVSLHKGYLNVSREWKQADRLTLSLPMRAVRMRANPKVASTAGCVALQRGPIVYCLEECDNGPDLASLRLPEDSALAEQRRPDLLGGCVTLSAPAERVSAGQTLYSARTHARTAHTLKAVPYALWANRGEGEMRVWIRE